MIPLRYSLIKSYEVIRIKNAHLGNRIKVVTCCIYSTIQMLRKAAEAMKVLTGEVSVSSF
jgi:hypothetical protein